MKNLDLGQSAGSLSALEGGKMCKAPPDVGSLFDEVAMSRPLPSRPHRAPDPAPSPGDGLQRLLQEMQGLCDLLPGLSAAPQGGQRG